MVVMDEEIKNVMLNAGLTMRDKIVQKINSNIPPPNAKSTSDRKGSSKTLIDTSQMLTSVGMEVITDEEGLLEVAAGIFDEDIAKYAIANEYGSVRTVTTKNKDNVDDMHQGYSIIVIPERSFMRSAYDENIDEIMRGVEEEVSEIMSRRFLGK